MPPQRSARAVPGSAGHRRRPARREPQRSARRGRSSVGEHGMVHAVGRGGRAPARSRICGGNILVGPVRDRPAGPNHAPRNSARSPAGLDARRRDPVRAFARRPRARLRSRYRLHAAAATRPGIRPDRADPRYGDRKHGFLLPRRQMGRLSQPAGELADEGGPVGWSAAADRSHRGPADRRKLGTRRCDHLRHRRDAWFAGRACRRWHGGKDQRR